MSLLEKTILFLREKFDLLLIFLCALFSLILPLFKISNEITLQGLLLSIATFSFHFLYSSFEEYKKNKEEILNSLRKKTNRDKHYKLLNEAVENAENMIYITTIAQSLTPTNNSFLDSRTEYYNTIHEIIIKKPKIIVTRIYGIPIDENNRKDRIKQIMEEFTNYAEKYTNYHIYVFDWKEHDPKIPFLSLQIVDKNFTGIANMLPDVDSHVRSAEDEDLCIDDKILSQYFYNYYQKLLENCSPINQKADLSKFS